MIRPASSELFYFKRGFGGVMTDARYNRPARLANLEDRVEALERINVERGIGRAQTDQAKAIRFIVPIKRRSRNC